MLHWASWAKSVRVRIVRWTQLTSFILANVTATKTPVTHVWTVSETMTQR